MRSRPPTSSILQPIERLGARMFAPPVPTWIPADARDGQRSRFSTIAM